MPLIYRGDLARREAVGIAGAIAVKTELFLPQIKQIKTPSFSPHPKHAAPILIDRDNDVIVEAIWVAFIVLESVRKMLCSQVKISKTLARWHPESILPVGQKLTVCDTNGAGPQRVVRQSLGVGIIFHEPDDRGIGQHPQVSRIVFINIICGKTLRGCFGTSNLSGRWVQMIETALADKPDLPATVRDNVSDLSNE